MHRPARRPRRVASTPDRLIAGRQPPNRVGELSAAAPRLDAVHGFFMAKSIWMVHAWVVPGWESPKGVFLHNNNNVHCTDGTNGVNRVDFCAHQ
jgi:hypothetical protein